MSRVIVTKYDHCTDGDPPVNNPNGPGVNEPAGFVQAWYHDFASGEPVPPNEGWFYRTSVGDGNGNTKSDYQIIADATAPNTTGYFGRIGILNPYYIGGDGVGGKVTPPNGVVQPRANAYVRMLYRYVSPFDNGPFVNKMWYLWDDANGKPWYTGTGDTQNGSFNPRLVGQGCSALTSNRGDNQTPFTLSKDVWYDWEWLFEGSTSNTGRIRTWIDGILVQDFQGIQTLCPGTIGYQVFEWAPIWGGTGGIVPQDQYQDCALMYMSLSD